jgi:predicted CoA-substrate-specific enzyme activase
MKSLGIDIGSRTIKSVLFGDDHIEAREVVDATSRPFDIAKSILDKYPGVPAMATGYGRNLLHSAGIPELTEIKACACGVKWAHTNVRTIVDIGGQDLKIISLDENGRIGKFEMNDRCAAGTGKFLEIMATRLEMSLEEFEKAALKGGDSITLSSLCAVFTESEVVGLLNEDKPREDIARAVHRIVIKRIVGMFRRIARSDDGIAVVGGGALNRAVIRLLKEELLADFLPVENPQIYAALGAAIICDRSAGKKRRG